MRSPFSSAFSRRRFLLAALAGPLLQILPFPIRAAASGRVLIIGGGWSGLAAARQLRLSAPGLDVVLLERQRRFVSLPLSNPWLAGLPGSPLLTGDYEAAAAAAGYRFVRADVTAIDRERRTVHSDAGRFGYDWLVLACGIREDYSTWFAGDSEAERIARREFSGGQTGPDIVPLRTRLAAFAGGNLLMNIPTGPYRCPPAPYERALCIAEAMKRGKIKGRLVLLDPGGGILGFPRLFAEQYPDQVTYVPHAPVRSVDPFRRVVSTEVDDFRFDSALLMPPQAAAEPVGMAGLLAPEAIGRPSGWADADPLHLHAPGDERVFLAGDLLGRVSPLFGQYPKTGHTAARLGQIVALQIAARAAGLVPPVELPDSLCLVGTRLDPPEALRIEASYRRRGDGVILQTLRQQKEPQPRGEDEAWVRAALRDKLGLAPASDT